MLWSCCMKYQCMVGFNMFVCICCCPQLDLFRQTSRQTECWKHTLSLKCNVGIMTWKYFPYYSIFTGGNRAKLPSSRWHRRGRSLREVFACSRFFATTDLSQICSRVTRENGTPCAKTTDSYAVSFPYNSLRQIHHETTVGEKPADGSLTADHRMTTVAYTTSLSFRCKVYHTSTFLCCKIWERSVAAKKREQAKTSRSERPRRRHLDNGSFVWVAPSDFSQRASCCADRWVSSDLRRQMATDDIFTEISHFWR